MEFFIFLYAYYVKGYISKDSSSIMIEYHLRKGVQKVELIYNYKGKDYPVGFHRNIYPERELRDTILWVTKEKWRSKGNLKIIVYYSGNFSPLMGETKEGVKEYFISGKNLPVLDFSPSLNPFHQGRENFVEIEKGHYINPGLIKTYQGPDKYSWRMLGYDAQHTGYYPFVLYPPLEYKWQWNWGGAGSWTAEISGCVGQNMLFIPKAHIEWNKIMAVDIETGHIIWERELTANAMTSALSEGDSLLFVGTWIGFNPDSDTTFYALNPFTGELKWAKTLKSVQSQPIVVDSIVYVPSFGLSKIFAFTYRGDSLWAVSGGGVPAYYDGRIFHKGGGFLQARNYITGDSIWFFDAPGGIAWLSIYDNKIFFFSTDTLFALNIDGGVVWKQKYFDIYLNLPLTFYSKRVYLSYGDGVYTFNKDTGIKEWEIHFSPVGGNPPAYVLLNKGGIGWVANTKRIRLLDSLGDILFEDYLPDNQATWNSWHFPISYKNFLIVANEDYIYVYKTDTILPPPETTYVFNSYIYYDSGNPVLYLLLPSDDRVFISIFDISGRKIMQFRKIFKKGENYLIFDKNLNQGVYFIKLKTSFLNKRFKILNLK